MAFTLVPSTVIVPSFTTCTKQGRQPRQMQGAKIAQRPMRREIARRQHPKRHVVVQPPGQLAGGKHTGRVAVQQHLHRHRRMKRLIARPILGVTGMKRRQVERLHGVGDEVRQTVFGKPVCRRHRQQMGLTGVIRQVGGRHP